ncbi:low temperature requirement protein LtrA [Rhizobium sp. BK591]|uniref:low temperature requirement protein A n=1 Tax=Rhizobium TaxID=379 RepID=UPI000BE8C12B|nr:MULTISPECIES: low temperature requirement protein A [Rhizobium]MBB3301097.1 low temperature requirement protein LtrA [Rhizobium sp. BK112]MBB3368720.1 low temperature requirement protein LtrA [Rhizobium sp. BK077]MBB3741676.1 low temperature requirement protein LtrA [Rhizobium sp. BK591]MBB4180987.1 low temperature requirement protein LtrA [Rhizobium sp. BK109]MBB4250347.1 low temperature requirement protein LtrA [Rhizobium sp. BK008]
MAKTNGKNWLRAKGSAAGSKVTFLELFFDLVFVFSISQLSHALAAHYTPLGAAEAALMTFAVWWVWIFTAWVTNWLDPDKMPVRGMLVALMMLGLLLSASIPEAFGDKGLLFAGAYVAMQVGRSLFTTYAMTRVDRANTLNFVRITTWLVVAGVFWIAGGLLEHEARLIAWVIALTIEYIGPAAGFAVPGLGRSTARDWDVSGAHMAERCALFVIICLGEAILVSGRTFSELPFSGLTSIVFVIAFIGTVAMWWLYFRFGHGRAAHRIEHEETPGSLARQAFTYGHIPILAGIIVHAVAVEFMFSHPHETGDLGIAAAVLGGSGLFLIGNLWFKGATSGQLPLSHLAGLVLVILLAFAAPFIEVYLLGILATLVLIIVAAWEYRSLAGTTAAPTLH